MRLRARSRHVRSKGAFSKLRLYRQTSEGSSDCVCSGHVFFFAGRDSGEGRNSSLQRKIFCSPGRHQEGPVKTRERFSTSRLRISNRTARLFGDSE